MSSCNWVTELFVPTSVKFIERTITPHNPSSFTADQWITPAWHCQGFCFVIDTIYGLLLGNPIRTIRVLNDARVHSLFPKILVNPDIYWSSLNNSILASGEDNCTGLISIYKFSLPTAALKPAWSQIIIMRIVCQIQIHGATVFVWVSFSLTS